MFHRAFSSFLWSENKGCPGGHTGFAWYAHFSWRRYAPVFEVEPTSPGAAPLCRGELKITDVNNRILKQGNLLELMGLGIARLDTCTTIPSIDAGTFVQAVEKHQWLQMVCLEKVAWRNALIAANDLQARAKPWPKQIMDSTLSNK
ncbi:hypothetical protein [Desulfovibrio desulfuricans]|uniref:hypothetical protein n=1 Tax=Desulfovibrio desulfuricans TaxID=876 RepID=UPI001454D688|nr:hypothetical protein [Desulfovibrio desulfuricans]